MSRLTFSVVETAEILGVSKGLVYSKVKSGEIKALKLGRKVVITKATIEELLGHRIEVSPS